MSTTQNMSRLFEAVDVQAGQLGKGLSLEQTGEREMSFTYYNDTTSGPEVISRFKISFLPGCAKVLIFHGVVIEPKYRNHGWGKTLHEFRLRTAIEVEAQTVMCTVLTGNSPEKAVLQYFGWKFERFVSPIIEMWVKVL